MCYSVVYVFKFRFWGSGDVAIGLRWALMLFLAKWQGRDFVWSICSVCAVLLLKKYVFPCYIWRKCSYM